MPPCCNKGYITFGSFNSLAKITAQTIALWAQVLKNVPASRMIIKAKGLKDAGARQRIVTLFAAQGIEEHRLELRDWHASTSGHLSQYNEIDIALDTFPYHGTTTTCEALWMGVPVVTLLGNRHVARVGLSLLTSIGLERLAAKTEQDYINIAAELSRDIEKLKSVRAGLRHKIENSSLTDAKKFTRGLEAAYKEMFFQQGDCAEARAQITNTEELKAAIDKIPHWYHKISLPGGITTPGLVPVNQNAYKIPENLTGMRVLDVGARDGYWTFEALKRGASQVVAIDDFSDYQGDRPWKTFDLCKKAFGYTDQECQRYDMSVYDIAEEKLGKFDIVFFFGVLYQLRYPLLALDKLSAVCKHSLFVESAILDDYSPYRGGFEKGYQAQMVMEFYPNREYNSNGKNWWVPSMLVLANMVYAAGFSDVDFWKLADKPQDIAMCRGFIKAKR
jgi:tRNA (mo5U34)-methyltransferase